MALFLLLDSMITLQFTLLVLELWTRFRSINANLLKVLPSRRSFLQLEAPTWLPSATRVRHLRDAYLALARALDLLQDHFGLTVVFVVASSLGGATAKAYDLLSMQLSWPSHGVVQIPVAYSLISMAYNCLKLLMMALSCAAVKDAAATTGVLLLRSSVSCGWCCTDLKAFLQLTRHSHPLSFSAAGFFTVDRRLLVSAVAVLVTYLVILQQIAPHQ
ncbi:uncharacterized protein LOC126455910 [Schistocerca serialis cubense]|uniref:uncharacterized protein LOC126455910 n=1 Tax=Schistocerca serialis cubense TaxID=2023355 RepID=UPI00214F243B|nr:uncharacterized protein LOC126455910 [Schistocerca serialis cubense]